MDPATRQIYEDGAEAWIASRKPVAISSGRLDRFAERVVAAEPIADLGCGPGWYASHLRSLGYRVVAVDASHAMLLEAAKTEHPPPAVCADLLELPFANFYQAVFDGKELNHSDTLDEAGVKSQSRVELVPEVSAGTSSR